MDLIELRDKALLRREERLVDAGASLIFMFTYCEPS